MLLILLGLYRTKTLLGRCYKLADDKRSIFIRIMILFGLHNTIGDDEAYGQQLMLVGS